MWELLFSTVNLALFPFSAFAQVIHCASSRLLPRQQPAFKVLFIHLK